VYHWTLWRSATQAPGHMCCEQSSYTWLQAFFDIKFALGTQCTNHTLLRPTLSIVVAWTIVKAQGKFMTRQTMEFVNAWSNYPHSSTCIVLEPKCLLSLVGYLGHYSMYFTSTHSNSTQPTLNCREDG